MSNMLLILLLSTAQIPTANWQPVDDPLVEARKGMVYCEDPNHSEKTCSALASYIFPPDGSILGEARGALNNDPPMSFVIGGKVTIRGRELCILVSQENLDGMQLLVGEEIFSSEEGDKLVAMVRESMADELLGKEMCEQHFADGTKRMSTATLNGVPQPDLTGEYAWIGKDDGYRLIADEPLFE